MKQDNTAWEHHRSRIEAILAKHCYNEWAVQSCEECACEEMPEGMSWSQHATDVLISELSK